MPRRAFNDAKEAAHSFLATGRLVQFNRKKRPTAALASSFHSRGRHLRLPSPKSGRALSSNSAYTGNAGKGPSLSHQGFQGRKQVGKDVSGERWLSWQEPGKSAGKPSPGGASQTLYGKSPAVFSQQYLYFLLSAWLRSIFSAQIINNQETVSTICSVTSIPNSSFETNSEMNTPETSHKINSVTWTK